MSGLQAARNLNSGEPSPDVLFSRRPSTKGQVSNRLPNKTKSSIKKTQVKKIQKKPGKLQQPQTQTTQKQPSTSKPLSSKLSKQPDRSKSKETPPSPPTTGNQPPQSPRSPATSCTCTCSCTTCARPSSNPSISDEKSSREVEKLHTELVTTKKLHATLVKQCSDLQTSSKRERKIAAEAKLELEQASIAWKDRERELVAAGTSTLNREKEMEEQCNKYLEQLTHTQHELSHVRSSHDEEHASSHAHLIAVNTETEELKSRIKELEERLTESMKHNLTSLESARNELEKSQQNASDTTATLVSAAWTDAEEQIRTETTRANKAEEALENIKTLMKTQDNEMKRMKKRLDAAESLPSQLRDMLSKHAEKDAREEEHTANAMKELKRERDTLNDTVKETAKERDALMERIAGMQDQVRNMTMKAKKMNADEFEDTFEAVMREEFDAMRSAYEEKLKMIKDQVTKCRYASDRDIKEMEKKTRAKIVSLNTKIMRQEAQIKVLLKTES